MRRIWFCILTGLLLLSIFASGRMIWPTSAEESLLAYWKFDEDEGDIAQDSSGNGKGITLYGNPTWVSGYSGNGLEFDGVDDWGTFSALYASSPTSLKIQALVYPHDLMGMPLAWVGGGDHIVHHPDNGQFVTSVHAGNIGFGVKLTNWIWYGIPVKTTTYAWHNFTGIWTKGGYLSLFLDGVLVAAMTVPDYYLLDPGFTPEIGSRGGTSGFFDGIMDEIKVWTNVSPPPPPLNFYTLTTSTSTGQGEYGATTSPVPGTYWYRPGTGVNVLALEDTAGQYQFDHWELNGEDVGSANPYPLTMDANYTLHAVFVTASYDVTIKAHCYTEATDVSVGITMDGSPTGFTTPHTFTGLIGTHTFTVPNTDANGHPFKQWSTGETSTTITVSSAGTYTAYYGTQYNLTITTTSGGTTDPSPGTHTYSEGTTVSATATPYTNYVFDHWELDSVNVGAPNPISVTMDSDHTLHAVFVYDVTIKAYCYTECSTVSVSITMDGSPTPYYTPHTFAGLTGTHTFTVPSSDASGHPFKKWRRGSTSTTITVSSRGTRTAEYGTIPDQDHFITESICDPETVDPAWAYDTASRALIFNVYDTLVFFDQEKVDEFIPYLATDWWINQPPLPDAPEGTDSTWYFEIRGTSGTHVMQDKGGGKWHEVTGGYECTDWVLIGGTVAPCEQIKMRRDRNGSPGHVVQYFHVIDYTPPLLTVEEKEVQFHDGDTLTTEDVEYSFERAMVQDRSGGPIWMLNEPLFGYGWPDKSGWPEDPSCPINQAVESNITHVWLNLAMPYPPFMQILCGSWASIVSKDFCIAHGDWDGDWTHWKSYMDPLISPLDAAGDVMCGTGPYMGPPFEDPEIGAAWWTHGVEWSIVRFKDHWQGWPAPHCSRYVDRVTSKVVYEWGTRRADFLSGYADEVYVPTAYLPAMIENWPTKWNPEDPMNPEEYPGGIHCVPGLPTLTADVAMFFTFDINPASGYVGSGALDGEGIPLDFFSDIRIRKAFAYSFNYTEFIEDMFWGEAEQPSSCVIEGIPYHNPDLPKYDLDLDKARDYFQAASADFNSPAYGVWDIGFKMTIPYPTGNVPSEAVATMLENNIEALFELGPDLIPDTGDEAPGTADIIVPGWGVTWPFYLGELVGYPVFKSLMPLFIMEKPADYPDPHNWVVPYMHTYGDFSYFQSYSNAAVDALIDEGIRTPDSDPRRQEIYETLQLMYYQDIPSVCIVQSLKRHWQRCWVQGWYHNPMYPGQKYFKHMWKGLTGDINGDNRVDILDCGKVSSHWYPGPPIGPAGYDKIADINPKIPDGSIDIYDAALVSYHWLEEVDP